MFPFVYKGKITYIGAIWLVINFFLGKVKIYHEGKEVSKLDVLTNSVKW